jgi:hypothetical protein
MYQCCEPFQRLILDKDDDMPGLVQSKDIDSSWVALLLQADLSSANDLLF